MASFSPRTLAVLEGFAGSLGLPLRLAGDGSAGFGFARLGTLSFTPSQDAERVLVSLSRRPDRLDDRAAERVLRTARLDPTTGLVIRAGLSRGGDVVFALGLDEAEVDLPAIETALQTLAACHDRAGA
jgi:type III secretion system chaperone SycN